MEKLQQQLKSNLTSRVVGGDTPDKSIPRGPVSVGH